MMRFLLGRVVQSLIVLLGVCTFVFFLMHMTGDPVRLLLPLDATPEDIERVRHLMGFDRPLHQQFLSYVTRLLQGDLGVSLRHQQPALHLLVERIPATLKLTLAALLVSLVIALPLGTISAMKRDTPVDATGAFVALLGQCVPTFWLGIMLIMLFAVHWRIFPALGAGTLAHLVLPAITLGAYSAALTTRMLRSSLLDVLDQDFVRTARAKGLRERTVMLRHIVPHAAIPVVTVIALQVGHLLSGSIVTETIFSYPGMGLLVVQAIYGRDFTLVQGFVILLAIVILTINIAVDILYCYLDPRVRLG